MPTSKQTSKSKQEQKTKSMHKSEPLQKQGSLVDNVESSEVIAPSPKLSTQLAKVIYILLLSTLGLFWLNQNSLSHFWQQAFHQQSPWSQIENSIWKSGGYLSDALKASKQAFITTLTDNVNGHDSLHSSYDDLFDSNKHSTQSHNSPSQNQAQNIPGLWNMYASFQPSKPSNTPPRNMLLVGDLSMYFEDTQTSELEINHMSNRVIPGQPILLKEGDKVFFAGDSMMQGIAPHAMRTLRNDFGIRGIDLSKQSTGLSYPKSFNWPKTIENTLRKHPEIRLLVMFLGPNDPWNMPSGKGGKYLKFKSDAWEESYRSRIKGILDNAREANVQVIWVGPPNMRRKKLSRDMQYLNKLYSSEVIAAEQVYISVNEIFNYTDGEYSDYKVMDDHNVKVRSGDGTHFDIPGQKMIAAQILSFIDMEISSQENPEGQVQ